MTHLLMRCQIEYSKTDTSDLREPEKVRGCQEKAVQAVQTYTLAHYPDAPSKFGELLLRIPELQRTCQVIVASMIFPKHKIMRNSKFNFIFIQIDRKGNANN